MRFRTAAHTAPSTSGELLGPCLTCPDPFKCFDDDAKDCPNPIRASSATSTATGEDACRAVLRDYLAGIATIAGANNREAAFLEHIEDMAKAALATPPADVPWQEQAARQCEEWAKDVEFNDEAHAAFKVAALAFRSIIPSGREDG